MQSKTNSDSKLYEEYIAFTREIKQLCESDAVICLYQCGSFSEIYTDDEAFAKRVCSLLNVSYATKQSGLFMIGWPKCSDRKYINVLLGSNITVGIVEQVDKTSNGRMDRKLVDVITPQTNVGDYAEDREQFFHSAYVSVNSRSAYGGFCLCVGINSIDLSTGKNFIEEMSYDTVEELVNKIKQLKHSSINIATFVEGSVHRDLLRSTAVQDTVKMVEETVDQTRIEDTLRRVFGGSNVPMQQKLNINMVPHATLALVLNLESIYRINPRILSNIGNPSLRTDKRVMFNVSLLYDVHILPKVKSDVRKSEFIFAPSDVQTTCASSVLDMFKKCLTSGGNREMRKKLLTPTFDPDALRVSYTRVEQMKEIFSRVRSCIKTNKIVDPERHLRRLRVNKNQKLSDLKDVYASLQASLEFIAEDSNGDGNLFAQDFNGVPMQLIKDYIDNTVDHHHTATDPVESFIKPGNYETLDTSRRSAEMSRDTVTRIMRELSDIIGVQDAIKLDTSGKDKNFTFQCTAKRSEALKAHAKPVNISDQLFITPSKLQYKLSPSKKTCTISSSELDSALFHLKNTEDEFKEEEQKCLNSFIETLLERHDEDLCKVIHNIVQLDMYSTISEVCVRNALYTPVLTDRRVVIMKSLRHPLIRDCVCNDVRFEDGKPSQVNIVMGLNASGKSTLGRSSTLAIYMAHCGFPTASELTFKPLKNIFTRISGEDDLNNSLSSFDHELLNSKFIIDKLDADTFVFGDELYASSEQSAILCLNAAFTKSLLKNSSKAFLTTHCHNLKTVTEISDSVQFCTMKTDFLPDGTIVFKRKLIQEDGEDRYGLKCATALFGSTHPFILEASRIEKRHVDEIDSEYVVPRKRSRYNAKLPVERCEVCKVTSQSNVLETHHIVERCTFDSHKLNGHVKMNALSNIVVLCGLCHDKIDRDELRINGWMQTSHGRVLDYEAKQSHC